jgi:hypothetical protein
MPQIQESEEDTIRKAEESRETTVVLFDPIQPGTLTKAVVFIALENLKEIESTSHHTFNQAVG